MISPYEVLVVDDSVFMRKIITDMISENPQYRVVATAKNGREALEKVRQYKPHVITMDIEMPEMNGLEALKIIMKEHPTPVIMLSSLTQEGANETIRALEWGAIDFVAKPSGAISLDLHKVKLLLFEKLAIAVQTKTKPKTQPVVFNPAPPLFVPKKQIISKEKNTSIHSSRFDHIVAIGTSTGGPRALNQVLSGLPADFSAPIVIVQHMPPNFTNSLAQRLDAVSNIHVVEASHEMLIEGGTAYIAPGGFHMTVYKDGLGYRLRISNDEPRAGHRPSVDMLFESMIAIPELKRHIVLMTGMGSDGAKGMLALKESGAVSTIAESFETSIVYGMPRAAVELECVMYLLPQYSISEKLIQLVRNT